MRDGTVADDRSAVEVKRKSTSPNQRPNGLPVHRQHGDRLPSQAHHESTGFFTLVLPTSGPGATFQPSLPWRLMGWAQDGHMMFGDAEAKQPMVLGGRTKPPCQRGVRTSVM